MKNLLVLVLLVSSLAAFAQTVEEAYTEFFNHEKISSNHCGRNIHYFLQYLDERGVKYSEGYVVSIHEDYGFLNHFDARWGSRSRYENGEVFQRQNWFFHVFAVIDGKAYDFSQNFRVDQPVLEYLQRAYLPASKTENIPMQGRMDKDVVLKNAYNLKMGIYTLEQYKKDYRGQIYEGSFIEMFNYYMNIPTDNWEGAVGEYQISYSQKSHNPIYNSVTYTYPKIERDGKVLPLKAEGLKVCRALGYLGAVPLLTEHEPSENVLMASLYASLKPDLVGLTSRNIRISFGRDENSAAYAPNHPLLHYAKQVSCTNLQSVLKGAR